MFRNILIKTFTNVVPKLQKNCLDSRIKNTFFSNKLTVQKQFSTINIAKKTVLYQTNFLLKPEILLNLNKLNGNLNNIQARPVTKYSIGKGKRKTVKTVTKRFFRLHWGAWIRTRAGRHKKLWKKRSNLKKRLRQHIFVNATQTTLLDKMVTKFWKRPKYYIEDPYEPYHTRDEFWITRKKPRPSS